MIILTGDAILEDTAAKHLESIEQDFDAVEPGEPGTANDGGDGTLKANTDATSTVQTALDNGEDPKGIMDKISEWYGDNPILARALTGAVINYVKTGNIYSALGAGLEGGVGALDSIAAGKAARLLKKPKNYATWKKKKDYTFGQDIAKLGITTKNRAYAKKLKDDAGLGKEWQSYTADLASRSGKHWTDEEREEYKIPDQTNAIRQAAFEYEKNFLKKDKDGKVIQKLPDDWFNQKEFSINFGKGIGDWNEFNRQQVNNGNPIVRSPISFIESGFAIRNSNLSAALFLGSSRDSIIDTSKIAYSKIRGVKGATVQDAYSLMYETYVENHVVDGVVDADIEERAREAKMKPFVYFVNHLAE